ncbi:hypothetical protein Anas_02051 [Armadillidium nasatum]|uniref:FAM193 C-terminal domain-containing protein n=1 Tax=Armadillidium nasatum TaxID=96803 RepID=A0A5N5T064_9CRUS|nr:hypothetical protein Anas_02051 [Armadillidium nasatum]
MERAAYNAQRRQLITGWGHLKSRQSIYSKYNNLNYPVANHSSSDKEGGESCSLKNSVSQDNQPQLCPCTECHKMEVQNAHSSFSLNNTPKDISKDVPKSCECHFCNSSVSKPQITSSSVLPPASVGVLPPLSQPQLSLYPHIHGTSANGDITSNQSFDDLGPLPSSSSSKPPIFNNPYLGSDMLTEQLIREWDLAYGDALTPPGMQPHNLGKSPGSSLDDAAELSNQIDNLSLSSNLPYSHFTSGPHSCSHMTLEKQTATVPLSCSNSSDTPNNFKSSAENNCNQSIGNLKDLEHDLPPSSVITHTKSCSNNIGTSQTSKDSVPSESDFTDPEEWSSGDESDGFSSSSSNNHKDAHCDCCYCHMLQSKPGGGRQRYSDRRERLLKILSHKKRTTGVSSSATNNETSQFSTTSADQTSNDKQIGQQTLDEIMNYIEGKRTSSVCHKKAAKKARQKERKLAMKRQEEKRNCENRSEDEEDEYEMSEENEEEEDGPLAELRRRAPDVTITVVKPGQKTPNQRIPKHQIGMNREASANAPNAKHPLTAKPLPPQPSPPSSMWNTGRATLPSGRLSSMPVTGGSNVNSNIPLSSNSNMNNTGMGRSPSGSTPTGGLSSLLKGMESLSKDQSGDKDGKSSQMVTIRRVMDPISSEPTVTITLKGEEPKKDKVLFKLVNGQACTGNTANDSKVEQRVKKPVKKPQERPVYNIPEGVSPEEAKRLKKKQKKERQKLRKEQEKLEEQRREQMKHLEIEKRKEFLKQQEAHIRKQQAALERQQQELLRQQMQGKDDQNKKKGKKGKKGNEKQAKNNKNNNNNKNSSNNSKMNNNKKGKNVSALVYDGDDVARNFSLPPGVSINKVAGQPGMVTISNNMSGQFAQPFLPNPNLYENNLLSGYPVGSHMNSPCYSVGPGGSVGYPSMFNGCGGPMPWNGGIDPCTGNPQESVIVVDTNSGTSSRANKNVYNKSNEMTSEEKIQAAVRGEIDPDTLNQTQKRKYKKCLKELQLQGNKSEPTSKNKQTTKRTKSVPNHKKSFEEMTSEEKVDAVLRGKIEVSALNQSQKKKYKKYLKTMQQEEQNAQQREEDELMDRMYEISKGHTVGNVKKVNKSKDEKCASSKSKSSQSNQVSKNEKSINMKTKSQNINDNSQTVSKSKNIRNGNTKKANETQILKSDSKSDKRFQQNQSQQKANPNSRQQSNLSNQKVTKQDNNKAVNVQNQKLDKKHQKGQSIQSQKNQTNQEQTRKQSIKIPQAQRNFQHQQQFVSNSKSSYNQEQKGNKLNSVLNSKNNQSRLQSNYSGNIKSNEPPLNYSQQFSYDMNSYGPSVGYANNDFGHEARYAQYLAANASTLASVEYETNNMNSQRQVEVDEAKMKGKKRGKKGQIEDLTTIDSVFTPKELATGELDDETDREVEAFKRFCLYSVPRGQKPKVNFNVKDIMIKKKH